ncbi:cytochrome d ubiquinol oxidase subunit II [Maricaulis sp. CAU 1757]
MTEFLPIAWAALIAIGVLLYVALDGFDLGIGMLSARARSGAERDLMTATIEPVWDGNETWLIIGGGGLLAAFPPAYAILMPAFYLPLLVMLAALIFRGVAFEFRHKAVRLTTRKFWNGAFFGGSLVAALAQGAMLGAFVQGVAVEDGAFAGGAMDWLTPFSLLTAIAVAIGYVLLGACWLYLKTEGELQARAAGWGRLALIALSLCFAAVSLAMLGIEDIVATRWGLSLQDGIDWGRLALLAPVPIIGMALCGLLYWRLSQPAGHGRWADTMPFLAAVGIFVSGYFGLAVSLFPFIVPFSVTVQEAAAHPDSQAFLLVGAVVMLPVILAYTAYVYSLFWGKVREGEGYAHD